MTDFNTVDLDSHLPALLFALGSKISLHAQRESARGLGLDMCEWRTIQILGRDGPSTINHVADRIAMDRGGTSRAITRLEERGLVSRAAAREDRRKSVVELTPAGQALGDRIAAFANAREDRLTRSLTDNDKARLAVLLRTLDSEIDDMLATEWRPEGAA
jgi:DNA-binding MarR family transcriptional regulator